MASVDFKVVAYDLASRTFREIGREAWAMALKVKAANEAMDQSFWQGNSQFKVWSRVILLSLPLIPPLIIAATNALAGLNSAIVSMLPGMGFLVLALVANLKELNKSTAFKELRDQWKEFGSETNQITMRLMAEGVRILTILLDAGAPVARVFGQVLLTWMQGLRAEMQSPAFEQFLTWVKTVGAANFGSLLRSLENLVVGLGALGMAFTNSGLSVTQWLETTTLKFRQWATDLMGPGSIGGFMTYFQTTWPLLKAFVEELGTAFVHLLQAIAPMSASFMEWGTAALHAFNQIPPSTLTRLAELFVALKLAAYGFAAGQWAVNAAMAANPITLVLGLLAALVIGFVLAWQHSETFRRIVTKAWNDVKDSAADARQTLQPLISWFSSPQGMATMQTTATVVATNVHASLMVIGVAMRALAAIAVVVFAGIALQVGGAKAVFSAFGNTVHAVRLSVGAAFTAIGTAWTQVRNALGNVPSFTWAINAANYMYRAAAAAYYLAGAIASLIAKAGGVAGALGSLASIFPGYAAGGRPAVGEFAIVGERGPELFVPDVPGTIIPADQTRTILGGGGGGGGNEGAGVIDPGDLARIVARELASVLQGAVLRLDDGGEARQAYLMLGGTF